MSEIIKVMLVHHLPSKATSHCGHSIDMYFHGNKDWKKLRHPLVLFGGVHGDEPEGVALSRAPLAWLQSQAQPAVVDWILIPCLNPDGYFSDQRVNGRGVDLNRNYPTKNWTNSADQPRYFPGPHAGSEVETQLVMEIAKVVRPQMFIHFHSWNPCIVCTGEPGRGVGELLAKSSGYTLTDTIGYPTPGSLSQFGWGENNIPVICIEEKDPTPDPEVWPKFKSAFEQIFFSKNLWKTTGQ